MIHTPTPIVNTQTKNPELIGAFVLTNRFLVPVAVAVAAVFAVANLYKVTLAVF